MRFCTAGEQLIGMTGFCEAVVWAWPAELGIVKPEMMKTPKLSVSGSQSSAIPNNDTYLAGLPKRRSGPEHWKSRRMQDAGSSAAALAAALGMQPIRQRLVAGEISYVISQTRQTCAAHYDTTVLRPRLSHTNTTTDATGTLRS